MAVIVFSGGHTLRVIPDRAQLVSDLTNQMGTIYTGWYQLISGDAEININPGQIAYIVEDADYADTFPEQAAVWQRPAS